ncbi:hypothetical protein H4R99_007471 [Coemansia sp. RSA 1722]|nr:hypothetical protein H4R99_007471 [Coemansia sp. RSA 1722]
MRRFRLPASTLQQKTLLYATKRPYSTTPPHPTDIWQTEPKPGDTVYVGMSGGVDSSVTAHLLKSKGLNVQAIFMRNWDTRDEHGECPSEADWRDVQKVCQKLDIKCHQINLVKEYWTNVFAAALDEYSLGRTPNPDILCNQQIKFGVLMSEINKRLGSAEWFATGHYARTKRRGNQTELHKGVDDKKDQSYYLARVGSHKLNNVVFPLGSLIKNKDVRKIAKDVGLHNAEKEESMGICFVGERRRFDRFLAEYLPQTPGDIVSRDGHNLGTHQGLFSKTIGQSAGIPGWQQKWYIYNKDIATNRMLAVQDRTHPLLHTREIDADGILWISGSAPKGLETNGSRLDLTAQIRHMQLPQKCTVSRTASGSIRATFETAQFGVAPGQYLVLYDGDQCLGSAVIQTPK